MEHNMSGAAGAVMTAAMVFMLLAMGGLSLASLRRAVPAAWRWRSRHAIERPAELPAAASREDAR